MPGHRPKTQQQIIDIATNKAVKELSRTKQKGFMSASAEMNCTASQSEVAAIVQKAVILYQRPRAVTDEDVADSLDWYFQEYLPKTGAFPTVEGVSAACGVDRRTFNDWMNGKLSCSRSDMCKKALAILAELDAQLAQSGKIPQVVYIFRAKNFHGMQDNVKVEIAQNSDTTASPDELAQKYADAIPADFAVNEDAES